MSLPEMKINGLFTRCKIVPMECNVLLKSFLHRYFMTNVQCYEIPMKIRNFIIMALENFKGAESMKSQIFMGKCS